MRAQCCAPNDLWGVIYHRLLPYCLEIHCQYTSTYVHALTCLCTTHWHIDVGWHQLLTMTTTVTTIIVINHWEGSQRGPQPCLLLSSGRWHTYVSMSRCVDLSTYQCVNTKICWHVSAIGEGHHGWPLTRRTGDRLSGARRLIGKAGRATEDVICGKSAGDIVWSASFFFLQHVATDGLNVLCRHTQN